MAISTSRTESAHAAVGLQAPTPRSARRRKFLKWFTPFMLVMATLHFARCYVVLCGYWIELPVYAAGRAKMPFQKRMLMMPVLRWAEQNRALQNFCAHHVLINTPDLLVMWILAAISMLVTAAIVTWLYLRASRIRAFWWMPWAILLLVSFVQYILHSDNNYIYPYDLPSLVFFSAGLALIYARRYWWLLLLFPVAALNRETIIFLVPLLLLDGCCSNGRFNWKKLRQPSLLALAAILSFIWLVVQIYVQHRFRANPVQTGNPLVDNIKELANPRYLPQFFSIGAFLPVFLWLSREQIREMRIRMYLWIFIPWFAVMTVYGLLVETRVFGELTGLFAVACTLAIEGKLADTLGLAHEPEGGARTTVA
jgi:hypothetical protein